MKFKFWIDFFPLKGLMQSKFPGDFKWAGEINVYKHALAANGFFENGDRVTEAYIK